VNLPSTRKLIGACLLLLSYNILIGQKITAEHFGNWFEVRNNWVDIHSPDLLIKNLKEIKLKHGITKSPCQYKLDTKLKGDTIVHITTLFCQDQESKKMVFRNKTIKKLYVMGVSPQSITLINLRNQKIIRYQKTVLFSNMLQLIITKNWYGKAVNYYDSDISLEGGSSQSTLKNPTQAFWDFEENGKLWIHSKFKVEQYRWSIKPDSTLIIISQADSSKIVKYKFTKIQPWILNFKKKNKTCNQKERKKLKKLAGFYTSDTPQAREDGSLRINNCFFFFNSYTYKKQIKGKFEIKNNQIIFRPFSTLSLRNKEQINQENIYWKFENPIEFSLPILKRKRKYYFNFPLNGKILKLIKE
jgi:hypothetical protein